MTKFSMVCGESAKGANPEPNGAKYPLVVHGLPGRFSVAKRSRFQLNVECPEKALSEIKRIWVKVGDRRISFTRHDNGFQATFALGAGFKLMSLLCQDHEGTVDALAHRLVLSRGKGKAQGSGASPVPFIDRAGKTSPFVSVIIVNHNGGRHLEDLFDSLREQTYPHFEIVFVDNGSTDDSVERALAAWPDVRVVAETTNAGFAEGNNIGQEAAKGNLLCLLNNDVTVAPNWLEELILEWKRNKRTGAVCSKVLFWKPFIELSLSCPPEGPALSLRESSLEEFHPRYGKVLYREPPVRSGDDAWIDLGKPLAVRLPYEGPESIWLTFQNPSSEEGVVEVCWGNGDPSSHSVPSGTQVIELKAAESEIDPRWVINNAGSRLNRRTLKVGDRGIFQYDKGQYDKAETVTAICGCSVLVDPSSIPGEPLFAKDFFTYFEDTDLSMRIHRNGYKLRYAPQSVAYHKHASSSKQDSPFFRFHLSRNRLYLNMLHAKESVWRAKVDEAVKNFRRMAEDGAVGGTASDKEFASMIPQLLEDLQTFEDKVTKGQAYERPRRLPRIGVYNSYWNTMGGGEHNALMYASHFSKFGVVDLIAENDFDLEALAMQFGVDLKHCRKRVIPLLDSACTAQYDVFINSTFYSCLVPEATTSYFVVMFPHKVNREQADHRAFLEKNQFLAISHYTRKWMKTYWEVDAEVLHPCIETRPAGTLAKERIILNVGRFFTGGHNKKQLELAKTFKEMKESGAIPDSWRLVLAGKVQANCEEYVEQIRREYQDHGVELREDLSLEDLNELYAKALVYWHATGVGEDPDLAPEKFEHFGITTCEALAHGCVPVVCNSGGQPEIVEHGVDGFVFDELEELKTITSQLIRDWEEDPNRLKAYQEAALQKAETFGRSSFLDKLAAIHPAPADSLTLL